MAERHSEFRRDPDDFYVEPAWCVDLLLERYPEIQVLHDPCCGQGTIVDAALQRGIKASGADLRDRANGRFPAMNFFSRTMAMRGAIVMNPPFAIAMPIIEHALTLMSYGGLVAAICQAKFLFSQRRYPLFSRTEMERVIIFSTRPSMPPGTLLAEKGEACRGGGSIDFCWCIWRSGKVRPDVAIDWTL